MGGKRVLIFSDCHLGAPGGASLDVFERFCRAQAASAPAAVYCLGDLFHHWVGRGHEREPNAARALAALGAFVEAGAQLVLLHGNRDFHLGAHALAALGGAKLAPHALEVAHFGLRLRLEHGDLLCARDTRYRFMRLVIRAGWARGLFLALPLGWRMRIAGGMRAMSGREVERKRAASFTLAPALVRARLRGVDALVIGHVHRAARRRLRGRRGWLFTLGAWEGAERSWIEIDGRGLRLHAGRGGEAVLETPLAWLRAGVPPRAGVAWRG